MNSTVSNAEVLRLQYLQAMGITTYYPRLQLPGALPSQACEWPFADKAEHPASPVATASAAAMPAQNAVPQPAPSAPAIAHSDPESSRRAAWTADERRGARDADERRGDATVPSVTLAEPAAAAAVDHAAESDSGEALQLQLLLLQLDADLAVVLQIPTLARAQLADRQRLLLANILRWLGKSLPAEAAPRVFRWPLPGLTLTNTRREAGASMLHFLEQACVEQPFRQVLMLGEAAADCLQAQQTQQAPAQGRDWQLFSTHSLDELLALPQLKRAAWQALLPLHAALSAQRALA